jgi:hypothetical protein
VQELRTQFFCAVCLHDIAFNFRVEYEPVKTSTMWRGSDPQSVASEFLVGNFLRHLASLGASSMRCSFSSLFEQKAIYHSENGNLSPFYYQIGP